MKALTYCHKYLRPLLSKDKVGVDMTCGKGNDTAFLARYLKKVYSFDIQKEAIDIARERTKDFSNITFINDDHATIDSYIEEKIDVAMFNLGYLPNSASTVITQATSTIEALEKLFPLLNDGAIVSIIFYRGHKGGLDEYVKTIRYLDHSPYQLIERYLTYTDIVEPIVYFYKK